MQFGTRLSIGIQTGPFIGLQNGPLCRDVNLPEAAWLCSLRSRLGQAFQAGSSACFEAPAIVTSFHYFRVMGGAIEQHGRHFHITEDRRPVPESEFRGDDRRALLIESVDQIGQELSAFLSEGQITQFI